MPTRTYDRLPIEDFGRQLIISGDLDPVYNALSKSNFDYDQMNRWLVAYWFCYHPGAASWLSEQEGEDFWLQLMVAARNEEPAPTGQRWPRASERRHWRGKQAIDSAFEMSQRWPNPTDLIEYLCVLHPDDEYDLEENPRPFQIIAKRVKENRGFGDWIAFKVADMIDRVLGIEVNFTQSEVFMYRDPVQGALMMWRRHNGLPDTAKPKDQNEVIKAVVQHLIDEFSDLKAPPLGDRPIGLQEAETCLCKWKSHQNGHYPLWHDVDEITEGLQPWLEHSATARSFLLAMPKRSGHEKM